MNLIIFLSLSLLLGTISPVFGDKVKMVLFSELDHNMETSRYYVETSWSTPNQTCLSDENRAVSYCVYGPGFWIGYEFPNYLSEHVGYPYIIAGKDGEETCGNFPIKFQKNFGSYQFAGINNVKESFAIFDQPKFEGRFQIDTENADVSLYHFSSMLIMGPSPVLLYQRENYEGLHYCIDPMDPKLQTPGAVFNIAEIDAGIKPGDVKSIRRSSTPCNSKRSRHRIHHHKKIHRKF